MSDSNDDTPDTPFARTKRIMDAIISTQDPEDPRFTDHMLNSLTLLTAHISPTSPNLSRLTFSLRVHSSMCNGTNNLHGGMVATIFDVCTSFCIFPVTRPNFWDGGHVTRSLNCVYLRPAPVGTEVLVEAELVGIGRTMAYMRGVLRERETGKVCYTCEHDKVRVGGSKV